MTQCIASSSTRCCTKHSNWIAWNSSAVLLIYCTRSNIWYGIVGGNYLATDPRVVIWWICASPNYPFWWGPYVWSLLLVGKPCRFHRLWHDLDGMSIHVMLMLCDLSICLLSHSLLVGLSFTFLNRLWESVMKIVRCFFWSPFIIMFVWWNLFPLACLGMSLSVLSCKTSILF